mgnify:CR=1 FL=1
MPNEIVWETQTRRIDELLPWDKNPRLLSEEQSVQLEKSIDSFGVVEPLAINQDGVLSSVLLGGQPVCGETPVREVPLISL